MSKINASQKILLIALLLLVSIMAPAQTDKPAENVPKSEPDEKPERVFTEEVKLNVLARNDAGHFDPTIITEDLMVVENRVPHTIVSLRRVPANVLIVLDLGGEQRLAKNLKTTREAAVNLVKALSAENSIAIIQYSDKPEILCEWTSNRDQTLESITQKTDFGRRSRFVEAMNFAANFLEKRPAGNVLENRHLVLITDGTDSNSTKNEREAALNNLIAANVSIHVLSYTQLEQQENAGRTVMIQGGEARTPRRTPEEHKITLPPAIQTIMNAPRLGSIILDREMLKKARQRQEDLKTSQNQLSELAADAGGEIFLPTILADLPEQARKVAGIIDSNYVVTYVPKRALANSPAGEVREVAVVSRRVGLIVQARRKFVVPPQNDFKAEK